MVDCVSDLQGGQSPAGPVTVGQLQTQLEQIQTALAAAAATAVELHAWSKRLPRRYVPPTEEVLVTDMTRPASSDPVALQRRTSEVEVLVLQVAAAMTQLRATAAADTGDLGRSLRRDPAPPAEAETGTAGDQLEVDEHDRSLSGAWHLHEEGESWVLANQNPATGFYRIQLRNIRTAPDLVRAMRAVAIRAETEPDYDLVHAVRALDVVFGRWTAGPWLDPIPPEDLDKHCRQRHTRDREAAQLRRMVAVPDPDRRRWRPRRRR